MSMEELESEVQSIRDEITELGEEQTEKLYNMPDQLQDADSGQLLQERYDACEEWASNLDGIDYSIDVEEVDRDELLKDLQEETAEEELEDEDLATLLEEKVQEKQDEIDQRRDEIFEEVMSYAVYEGS
jgi:Skp family chaperone for outer membrane proteins